MSKSSTKKAKPVTDKITDLIPLPLLPIMRAEGDDCIGWNTDTRDFETRVRLWGLGLIPKENMSDGVPRTMEVRVILETMPDFCGGYIMYSPQVFIHSPSSWHSQYHIQETYHSKYGRSYEYSFSNKWSEMLPESVIDLVEYTGKQKWRESELREYGKHCLAASIMGMMVFNSRRGLAAADRSSGKVSELMEHIQNNPNYLVPSMGNLIYAEEVPLNPKGSFPGGSMYWANIKAHVPTPTWFYNENSGNTVTWWQLAIGPSDYQPAKPPPQREIVCCYGCDHEFEVEGTGTYCCPECEYEEFYDLDEYDEDGEHYIQIDIPDWWREKQGLLDKLRHKEYVRRCPRGYWRNG